MTQVTQAPSHTIENVSYTKSNNSLPETPTQLNDDELMAITGGLKYENHGGFPDSHTWYKK
jgi:bacteriocin-like protein